MIHVIQLILIAIFKTLKIFKNKSINDALNVSEKSIIIEIS